MSLWKGNEREEETLEEQTRKTYASAMGKAYYCQHSASGVPVTGSSGPSGSQSWPQGHSVVYNKGKKGPMLKLWAEVLGFVLICFVLFL